MDWRNREWTGMDWIGRVYRMYSVSLTPLTEIKHIDLTVPPVAVVL
jgi:hypothetical protein